MPLTTCIDFFFFSLYIDGLSDKSSHSGQGALNCESAPQGNSELEDIENKARKVKKTKEKEKKKEKGKLKVKEKKQKEENEDPERKIKRKGFGAMLRYGTALEAKLVLFCFVCSVLFCFLLMKSLIVYTQGGKKSKLFLLFS